MAKSRTVCRIETICEAGPVDVNCAPIVHGLSVWCEQPIHKDEGDQPIDSIAATKSERRKVSASVNELGKLVGAPSLHTPGGVENLREKSVGFMVTEDSQVGDSGDAAKFKLGGDAEAGKSAKSSRGLPGSAGRVPFGRKKANVQYFCRK